MPPAAWVRVSLDLGQGVFGRSRAMVKLARSGPVPGTVSAAVTAADPPAQRQLYLTWSPGGCAAWPAAAAGAGGPAPEISRCPRAFWGCRPAGHLWRPPRRVLPGHRATEVRGPSACF